MRGGVAISFGHHGLAVAERRREGKGTHASTLGAATRLVLADREENGVVRVCHGGRGRFSSHLLGTDPSLSLSIAVWHRDSPTGKPVQPMIRSLS